LPDPLHVWFYGGVCEVGGLNGAISGFAKSNRYVGENNARGVIRLVTSPVITPDRVVVVNNVYGELVVTLTLVAILTVSPTPRVTWRRLDTQLVEGAGNVHIDSYGQELVFAKVDFSDQGTYECMAVNTASGYPHARRVTELMVVCKPGYSILITIITVRIITKALAI